ncbi:MAG: hypothetical protein RLZZ21_1758 [Planctomycetota bacterium]|jgi:hypothetical protein
MDGTKTSPLGEPQRVAGVAALPLAPDNGRIIAVLALVFSLFAAVNLLTLTRWPIVWCDEPYFLDPAYRLAFEGRFASEFSSRSGSPEAFWEGNCPLYPLLTGYWMRLFGFSVFSVRSFVVLTYFFAVAMIVVAMRRFHRLQSITAAILLPTMLFSCYGMDFLYRQCRYEALCVMECAAVFLVLTIDKPVVRRPLLVLVCATIPWSGFPAVAWTAAAFLAGSLTFGRRVFVDGMIAGIGVALGLASLFGWLASQGVVESFLGHLGHVQDRIPFTLGARTSLFVSNVLRDRAGVALMCASFTVVVARLRTGDLSRQSPVVVGLLTMLCGAVLQAMVTSRVYDWTVTIPLAVGLAGEFGTVPLKRIPFPERFLSLALVTLASMGLPSAVLAAVYEWNERDHARVETFVASHLEPDDFCFCDISAYFPTRRTARRVRVDFGSLYTVQLWNDVEDEARKATPFTVMLVRTDRSARTIQAFGGGWKEVARMPACRPTWRDGSLAKKAMMAVLDIIYPPSLDPDLSKRIATDHPYDLVVLRPASPAHAVDELSAGAEAVEAAAGSAFLRP